MFPAIQKSVVRILTLNIRLARYSDPDDYSVWMDVPIVSDKLALYSISPKLVCLNNEEETCLTKNRSTYDFYELVVFYISGFKYYD